MFELDKQAILMIIEVDNFMMQSEPRDIVFDPRLLAVPSMLCLLGHLHVNFSSLVLV